MFKQLHKKVGITAGRKAACSLFRLNYHSQITHLINGYFKQLQTQYELILMLILVFKLNNKCIKYFKCLTIKFTDNTSL